MTDFSQPRRSRKSLQEWLTLTHDVPCDLEDIVQLDKDTTGNRDVSTHTHLDQPHKQNGSHERRKPYVQASTQHLDIVH